MAIVDSHCHVSPYWYEPVESLLFQMDRNGVEKAVLVQYMGQFNNEYQFQCVRRFPGRFASVVLVDAHSPEAVDELERLVEQGAKGIRLRPNTRSPGDDPLAIWRKAAELKLPVSCGGTSGNFASGDFARLVQAFPNLPIVIEHLGSVNTPDGETKHHEIRRRVFTLSRFPNVYIKIHGLGEFCKRMKRISEPPVRRDGQSAKPFPFEIPIPAILEMAYEAFGSERMMWGSDYPPVSGREGYGNALRLTLEQFQLKSKYDKEMIFGRVAEDIFCL
ncbi:amidohydrolase family protein [Candidatus Poribacteria bacterium]